MSRSGAETYFARALELAERGRYTAPPNPLVGAVVVRAGRVVGEAWHRRAGSAHAEAAALASAGSLARGADLYVTLEPCAHFGRTPPCAPAIVAAGIRRIFVAARDPNPLVAGRGLRLLRRAGVGVTFAGPSVRLQAERQNEKFRVSITEGRPFVLAKWAATLDGKTASGSGHSRWITGPAARRRALLLREEYDAVLVGAGTVRQDDPLLTRRLGKSGRRPHRRIVMDGRLKVSTRARVFRKPEGTVVVTAVPGTQPAARRLAARGVEVWSVPGPDGKVSVPRLLSRLARAGVTSLLVEGGAETLWGFFRAGLVDRVAVFSAPTVLGGKTAPGGVGGEGFPLRGAARVVDVRHERVGDDWLVTGLVSPGGRRRRERMPGR